MGSQGPARRGWPPPLLVPRGEVRLAGRPVRCGRARPEVRADLPRRPAPAGPRLVPRARARHEHPALPHPGDAARHLAPRRPARAAPSPHPRDARPKAPPRRGAPPGHAHAVASPSRATRRALRIVRPARSGPGRGAATSEPVADRCSGAWRSGAGPRHRGRGRHQWAARTVAARAPVRGVPQRCRDRGVPSRARAPAFCRSQGRQLRRPSLLEGTRAPRCLGARRAPDGVGTLT